ncbi:MAG: PorP/SprF family type IX secretion system membrane protein [Saprospiraceae bacterium]|nr:PorP/SprF family type IX secretion system membrane protein [Saprospiraceae bacterium]
MKHIFNIFLGIILFSEHAMAQQFPLFSNYIVNGYGYNPAMIGQNEHIDLRGTYRTQWVGLEGQPQTQIVMINGRIGKTGVNLGGNFYNDVAGKLKKTGTSGLLSYTQKLDDRTNLSIGLSGGYFKIDVLNEVFAEHLNDPTIAGAQKGMWVPDLSMGAFIRQKDGFFAGLSVPQLFRKKLIFDPALNLSNPSSLIRHYYGLAGYTFKVSEKMKLEPSAMVKVSENVSPQFDFTIKGIFNNMFWVGGSYRTEDAIVAMAGIEYPKWYAAYSYDVTTSPLRNVSSNSHELTFGFRFGGKCKDEDKDGVCDKDDKCPTEPGTKENHGCPEKKPEKEECPDKDKDGICDKDDKCPDIPGTKENKGCPFNDRDGDGIRDDIDKCPDIPGSSRNEGCPLSDRDKDGILDEIDPCPDEAGPLTNMGCPPTSDRDKDGVVDKDDACPDTPGPKENKGCPFGGDRDGDGIPDDIDKCPNTAGPKDNNGCPVVTQEEKDALSLAIRNLYFDTDKWIIRPSSFRDLNNVVNIMKKKKDWKLTISGHADIRGNDEHNLMLSRNRANAVKNYLVSKGIPPNLLITEYFGASQADRDKKNESKLQQDRRVELEFYFD